MFVGGEKTPGCVPTADLAHIAPLWGRCRCEIKPPGDL